MRDFNLKESALNGRTALKWKCPCKFVLKLSFTLFSQEACDFRFGDTVQVKKNIQVVEPLQQGHGGWNHGMMRVIFLVLCSLSIKPKPSMMQST